MFVLIVVLIILADIDYRPYLIRMVEKAPFGDKVAHLTLFGLLAAMLNVALDFRKMKLGLLSLHVGSVVILSFAIAEEFSQLFLTHRTFDIWDMAADLVGIYLVTRLFRWRTRRLDH